MTNIEYFEFAKENKEELFDEFYEKNILIIPSSSNEDNELTKNNAHLIELITAFNVLRKQGKTIDDETIKSIVGDIVELFNSTPSINYSAFSQFFMVQNVNYSIYRDLSNDNKTEFIYKMLLKYCEERHEIYMSHGYTNTILQVMCDNYSSRRNGKSGIDKVMNLLEPLELKLEKDVNNILVKDKIYFLPDKGGEKLFEEFSNSLNLNMQSRLIEQNKRPDIVFKYNNHYYICELKNMKQGGGTQNKQIVEVSYFIKFKETNKKIHYLVFLDGLYFNELIEDKSPKIDAQRMDIEKSLNDNSQNYFLNTKSFIKFVNDLREGSHNA